MPILTELNLYPIKSCAVITLQEATLTAAGLQSQRVYDREWMVIGMDGVALTQRVHPRMALIQPRIGATTLDVRAPGMPLLQIPLDLPSPERAPTREVRVWASTVRACDCDDPTAAWFTQALGIACRLVRFHPHATRLSNLDWTKGVEVPILFPDGYPLLVAGEASLHDVNEKMLAHGRAALRMNRFRANIVLRDLPAFEEDFAAAMHIGPARLQVIKSCSRCILLAVDQDAGAYGPNPLDILQGFRALPRLDGRIGFGVNCRIASGAGTILHLGQEVDVELAF